MSLTISCVNYSNSFPFIYGLEKSENAGWYSLSRDTPADCYLKLQKLEVDIGLVPVIALKTMADARIISPYCIGSGEKVHSVILFSHAPPSDLKKIYLDYQSRTSVELVKILYQHHWKKSPVFIQAKKGFESQSPEKHEGFVIIGDRAMEKYAMGFRITDLAEEWRSFSGYPFVFAAWISRKDIPDTLRRDFNAVLKEGIENIPDVIAKNRSKLLKLPVDPGVYFTKNINYHLDALSQKGLELFLHLLKF